MDLAKGIKRAKQGCVISFLGVTLFCVGLGFGEQKIQEYIEGDNHNKVFDFLLEKWDKFLAGDGEDKEAEKDLADAAKDVVDGIIGEDGELVKASLVRVVDGDTIIVDIYGDKCGDKDHEYSVRMIGINTPESVASEEYLEYKGTTNSEEGKAASAFLKGYLANTDYVYLQKDVSETDKYDRLLRYVWLDIPEEMYDLENIETYMLNAILVKEGYAEVATYAPDITFTPYFEEIAEDIDR